MRALFVPTSAALHASSWSPQYPSRHLQPRIRILPAIIIGNMIKDNTPPEAHISYL